MHHLRWLRDIIAVNGIDQTYFRNTQRPLWVERGAEDDEMMHHLTERIATRDIDPAITQLPSARNGTLEHTLSSIAEADHLAQEFTKHFYFNTWYVSKCYLFALAGYELNTRLLELQNEVHQDFSATQKEMLRERKDISALRMLRQRANALHDEYLLIVKYGQERKVAVLPKPAESFAAYAEQRAAIKNISLAIANVNHQYENAIISQESCEELHNLSHLTSTGIFSLSWIAQQAKRNKYYEGLVQLKELHQEIRNAIRHGQPQSPGYHLKPVSPWGYAWQLACSLIRPAAENKGL